MAFENGFKLRPFRREFREFKPASFLEADEEDAFAVLRHDAPRIYDLIINGVAERLGQCVVNDLKRAALVVAAEVLHVLQHERRGPVVINDVGQREEEVALFLVLEAVLFAEAQFLGDTRDAEGFGRENRRTGCRARECPPRPRYECRRAVARRDWLRR
jgi:hypothetical protein